MLKVNTSFSTDTIFMKIDDPRSKCVNDQMKQIHLQHFKVALTVTLMLNDSSQKPLASKASAHSTDGIEGLLIEVREMEWQKDRWMRPVG